MLKSVMRSTMQFFESVPMGRLLNRFSKDMNSVELQIPVSMKDFVYCIADGLSNIVVIAITTPFALIFLVPIIFLYLLIQVYKNFLIRIWISKLEVLTLIKI